MLESHKKTNKKQNKTSKCHYIKFGDKMRKTKYYFGAGLAQPDSSPHFAEEKSC